MSKKLARNAAERRKLSAQVLAELGHRTFSFTVWTRSGPRDQTNCIHGWGRRTVTVQAVDTVEAIRAVIAIAGPTYGGLVQ